MRGASKAGAPPAVRAMGMSATETSTETRMKSVAPEGSAAFSRSWPRPSPPREITM